MGSTEIQNQRRRLLQEAFLKKKERNPRFTLRAFAAQLGINSGTLSRLISDRQTISEKTFELLKEAIMAEVSIEEYQFSPIKKLELEQFRMISKWYHLAILELTYLQGFQPNTTWIGETLGISSFEASDAVDRLVRLGLLKKEGAKWIDTQADLSTIGTVDTDLALRSYQKEILELAKESVDSIPVTERDCTTLTVSLNSSELKQVRDILTSARRRVNELSAKSEKKNAVYQLSIAFFPVSRKLKRTTK